MTAVNITATSAPFKVATIKEGLCSLTSYNRRDFYKITLLLTGHTHLLYANRGITVTKPALVFTNPLVPYSWEMEEGSGLPDGFFLRVYRGFYKTSRPCGKPA